MAEVGGSAPPIIAKQCRLRAPPERFVVGAGRVDVLKSNFYLKNVSCLARFGEMARLLQKAVARIRSSIL